MSKSNNQDGIKKVRLLWHVDYYDGPLSGIAELDGKCYWFDLLSEKKDNTRRFSLKEITPEELEIEKSEHEVFVRLIGNHTEYDEENKRRKDVQQKPITQWGNYYDQNTRARAYSRRAGYQNRHSIGHFKDSNWIFYPKKSLPEKVLDIIS